MTLFHPSGRPAGGWPRRWVAVLGALLLVATLIGLSHAAGAQQSTDTTVAGGDSTTTADTSADDSTTTAPDNTSTDTTVDASTTTAADDGNAGDPNGNINNLPLHDGTQKGNVFNATPYGEIPANTPQVLVLRPGSGRILPLNTEIQIRARFANFEPGLFNDPKTQYGIEPQRLNAQGNLRGHNHGCIQRVAANGAVPDVKCDSFVVLEQVGDSDILQGVAPPLTVAGRYRVCVDAASGAHYVAARAFAQQGGPADCVRILVMNLRWRR